MYLGFLAKKKTAPALKTHATAARPEILLNQDSALPIRRILAGIS
jgi:hypothetical protein